MNSVKIIALALTFVAATIARGQEFIPPVTFVPSAPTEADAIAGRILFQGPCGIIPTTERSGMTIRTTLAVIGCGFGPPTAPTNQQFPIGQFPSGTYSFELYWTYEGGPPELILQQPLIVAATAVPLISRWALGGLTTFLVTIGFFRMRG